MKILPQEKRLLGIRVAGRASATIGAKNGGKPMKKAIREEQTEDK